MYSKIIKKISITDLVKYKIIIPNFQRLINPNKINDIVEYQLNYFKENNQFNFLGVIHIVEFLEKNQKEYLLIDGQHRFQAAKTLAQKHAHYANLDIEWIITDNQDQLIENYQIINKNTTLPTFASFLTKTKSEKITKYFFQEHNQAFADLVKTKRPKISFVFFQDAIAYLCDKLIENSENEIIKFIEDYNQSIKSWDPEIFKNKFSLSNESYEKMKKWEFFLGAFKHEDEVYHYEFIKKIHEEKTGVTVTRAKKKKKKKINNALKKQSWNKYIGQEVGQVFCIVCNHNFISQHSFEAGHIISEKNNGPGHLDNILPICSDCNRSMGSTNMENYIQQYHPENLKSFYKKKYKANKNFLSSFI